MKTEKIHRLHNSDKANQSPVAEQCFQRLHIKTGQMETLKNRTADMQESNLNYVQQN